MTGVLDAHGLLVFLEKEAGYEKVERSFVDAVEKDKGDYLKDKGHI